MSKKTSLFHPAVVAEAKVEEVVYPSSYELRGAGSAAVNGLYHFKGLCNKRPYYGKDDGLGWLWYFETSMFPASMWCGWYISKEVNTANTSATGDYYSAYVHSKLPPSTGWVTREKGFSPTSGCGANPAPSYLMAIDTDPADDTPRHISADCAEDLVLDGIGCSDVFPKYIAVHGAGVADCNGWYCYAGEANHRPYYLRHGGTQALWYFASCPLHASTKGMISYNGWYLSSKMQTSNFSAALDMYTSYLDASLPPTQQWITRYPGVTPTSGCGRDPVPVVEAVPDGNSHHFLPSDLEMPTVFSVQLVRIMLPTGRTISLAVSEEDKVLDLLIRCEDALSVPMHCIKLHLRETELPVGSRLFACGIAKGDILATYVMPCKPLQCSKQVCVIGAGPVGLWTAIQLKCYCPQWTIRCYEKRSHYTRSHALRLDADAFDGMIDWMPGRPAAAELRMLKEKWCPRTRTAVVEDDLRALATAIGIQLSYDQEVALQDFLNNGTDDQDKPDIIIACDGARSQCRKILATSTPELRADKKLGSLLQVKFDAQGEVQTSKGLLSQFLQNVDLSEHFFNVLCGNFDAKTCTTPVTIFALLNDEVASALADHSSTATPEEGSALHGIHSDLSVLFAKICPGGIIESSLQITKLPVAYTVAGQVAHRIGAQAVYLAGDAAMGLPLEKGLNYGWRIASRLCAYIAHSEDMDQAYEAYFKNKSDEATAFVTRAYGKYLKDVSTASFLRSFVRPFV